MKKYWVYVHTCNANGKRYVGITTAPKPEYRWGRNGEGYKGQLFGRAILKYGWSSITHEVFQVESEEEMYRKEIELISFYHSNDPEYGYNCSTGGECIALGCRRSEETRRKISKAQKGKTFSEEYRKKLSEAQKKRCSDPEFREKMSKIHRGKTVSEESRKKMSESHRGKPRKPFSERHRKHISENVKERWADPEYRKKISETLKGRPQPRITIKLPDGTVIEVTKQVLTRWYINKGKAFEYVS